MLTTNKFSTYLLIIPTILLLLFGNVSGLSATTKASRTLVFSGITWQVRSGTGNPGNNSWSDSEQSVWVDNDGFLHMKIRMINGKWYCSEIYTQESIGYGEYRFYVSSNVEMLNRNAVLGLFTYIDDLNEIDIEFSKWGVASQTKMGWYVTQPSTVAGNRDNFALNLNGSYSTHRFIWQKDFINYKSWHGHAETTDENMLIHQWNYTGESIPKPGPEELIINLWLYKGNAPSDGKEVEVLIKAVEVNIPPAINDLNLNIREDTPLLSNLENLVTPGYSPADLHFTILEGNELGWFSVSPTGVIFLAETADYETAHTQTLKICASKGDQADTAIVNITIENVNDNSPFIEDTIVSIPENSPENTILGTVNVSDADGDKLTLQIISGNENNLFQLDSAGTVLLNKSTDYEQKTADTLFIQANDGKFVSTGIFIVNYQNINDNKPQVVGFSVEIAEDFPVQNKIGQITFSDADGDSLQFEIITGNAEDFYSITKNGELVLEKTLDFETNNSDSLSVRVSDGLFDTIVPVTIRILNIIETDLENFEKIEILLYPNPVSDWLTVVFPINLQTEFEIFNMKGISCEIQNFNTSSEKLEINTRQLIPGSYILVLKTSEKVRTFKFSKQ